LHRSMIIAALAVCLVIPAGSVARADTSAQARKQIQANYNSQNAAMARKDLKGTLAHTDPAFVGKGLTGDPQTYKMRVASLPHLFQITKSVRITSRIQKIVLHGDTADVQVQANTMVTVVDPKTGKVRKHLTFDTIEDRWVKRPRGWMLLRTQVLTMSQG
jgi:hypothetical protein